MPITGEPYRFCFGVISFAMSAEQHRLEATPKSEAAHKMATIAVGTIQQLLLDENPLEPD